MSFYNHAERNQENDRHVEMEQNPVFTISSVYLKQTVITAQPQGTSPEIHSNMI